MADLLATYSKTPKGLRARSSFIGGLSGKLFKVLSFVDGMSKAQTILSKHDDISEEKLLDALTKLEADGYIKAVAVNIFDDDDWDFNSNPQQIVVEELQTEEVASMVQQADDDIAAIEVERQNKQVEQTKVDSKALQQQALIKAIQKAKVETKVEEQIGVEQAAAAQQKLKAEALERVKAAKIRSEKVDLAIEAAKIEQAKQIEQNIAAAKVEKHRLAIEEKANSKSMAEQRAQQEQAQLAQQYEIEKSAKAKLAAQKFAEAKAAKLRAEAEVKDNARLAASAEKARLEKAYMAQEAETRRAEKAALAMQKIALAEAEQIRLMEVFEAQAQLEAVAAQQAIDKILQADDDARAATKLAEAQQLESQRAELAIAAKEKIKAKADARAKAEAEQQAKDAAAQQAIDQIIQAEDAKQAKQALAKNNAAADENALAKAGQDAVDRILQAEEEARLKTTERLKNR